MWYTPRMTVFIRKPVREWLQELEDAIPASSDFLPTEDQKGAMDAAAAPAADNPLMSLSGHRARVKADLGYLSLEQFGAVGDGVVDDTDAVNAAFAAAIAQKCELRAASGKKYRLTDTIYVGPDQLGTSAYASFHFSGAHGGYDPEAFTGQLRGCAFISEVTDKPAFAFSLIRNGVFEHCSVIGGMPGNTNPDPSFDEADYVGAYRTDRYSPHAGLAIDPYSGSTPPGGGYPGATYFGVGGSYKIHFEHVRVLNFVVGIAVQPSNFDGNASSVTMTNGEISNCAYGVSVGGAQNRNCIVTNVSINQCREAITNARHGARFGSIPKVNGGEWTRNARLFYVSSNVDSLNVHGLYCEDTRSLGVIGQQHSTPAGAAFTGCNFGFESAPTAACIMDIGMPCTFTGCTFGVDDSAVGIVVRGPQPIFNNCMFQCVGAGADGWFWLPGTTPDKLPRFNGCVVSSNGARGSIGSTALTGINHDSNCTSAQLAAAKRNPYLPTSRRIYTEQGAYDLLPPRDVVGYAATPVVRKYYVPIPTNGTYTFGSTTLTLTATHGFHFAVGDVLLWPMLPISAAGAVGSTDLPALRVASVVSNTVTCTLLYGLDEYDQTNVAVTVKCLPQFWAWNPMTAPLIGVFNGTATVTFSGRDPRDYLVVGDFVFQQRNSTMIDIYRVTALGASTATLCQVAGASSVGAGFPLMFGEMHREGGRFRFTFTSADLISSRYLFVYHGMQARDGLIQVFDNTGAPFTPATVNASGSIGSGICELDLGASPPTVTGTWTVIGQLVETDV